MSEHTYSNQKSALEDYFESLFQDEEMEVNNDEQVRAEPVKAESQPVISEKSEESEVDNVEAAAEPEKTIILDIKHPSNSVENTARNSVADMLANVEKLAVSEPDEIKEFAEPVAEIPIAMPKIAEQVEAKVEVVEEVKLETAEPEIVEVTTVEEQVEVAEAAETKAEIKAATSAVPEWAEERFQCLMFKVGGLSLAVPLVKLNGVISWTDKIVETPNQTDWYLGVLMNHGNKVEIIDTAVMVLPEQHREEMAADPADRLSHILLVDDQHWGLACDSIGEVVWLKPDDVKWRSNKTKRPWLLGTAINHMCAVLDTEAFAEMLGNNNTPA